MLDIFRLEPMFQNPVRGNVPRYDLELAIVTVGWGVHAAFCIVNKVLWLGKK